MTLPDPLSEASKQQLAKQIEFFQALTSRAFDNAERILALNIQTTRATLDHTSGAVRQLAEARHPRDFAALGTQSQQQMEAVIAYGRKLMEITNKPVTPTAAPTPAPAPEPEQAAAPAASAPAPDQHIDTAPPVMVAEPAAPAPEPVLETAAEPEPEPEPAQASAVTAAEPVPADVAPPAAHVPPSTHPLGEADADPAPAPAPAPAIAAKPTLIAQAVSEVTAVPLDIPHPAAALAPEPDAAPIAIPALAPVDAAPAQRNATPAPLEGGGPPKRARGAKKR